MNSLPLIRSHERMDFKRCPKKWYWKWRKGYVPRAKSFGALDLGTWVHLGFQGWYIPGLVRNGELYMHFNTAAELAIAAAQQGGAPEYVLDKAWELASLGEAMCKAYQEHYGSDSTVDVLGTEIPLEFTIPDYRGSTIAIHRLKPDMVYRDTRDGGIWLMENKTAGTIRTEHLTIDDQARPYGAMAERALKKAGVLGKHDEVKGIMYNYVRKQLPDMRERNEQGQALNKNGTVSAKQPAVQFVRKPILLTTPAKRITLERIRAETIMITDVTKGLRTKHITPDHLTKTPHNSCPKFCDYFPICEAEEKGIDIRDMERSLYTRQDPYAYEESTTEPTSFEMG